MTGTEVDRSIGFVGVRAAKRQQHVLGCAVLLSVVTIIIKFRRGCTRRDFGRFFVSFISGSTAGLFLGGSGPPVPAISGRFWEVRGGLSRN